MNQGDGDDARRPTSSCPDCTRPGHVDPNQLRFSGTPHHPRGAERLDSVIRFSCSCGAVWLCNSIQAHEMGDWLKRVGLYGRLSPPAMEGLVAAPPKNSPHEGRLPKTLTQRARNRGTKKRPPPAKGTGA